MVEDDVRLIHKVLSGDNEAFTTLVLKYQKSVHALAWRRVGDFHFAEEITQDVFLRIYKHLPKLKDPRQFSGWIYVTTNRLCNTWLKKNKSEVKSLEDVSVVEVERSSYSRYVSERHREEVDEHRYELVKQLLEKLPESERTVMTLYYLGEMTAKEIGNFLGVSVNTITSRLQRARERLQQYEELLVQEMLGSVQLSDHLTENIVRKVADVKLTSSPTGKPLLPWAAFGAASVLVTLLLLGLNNQYLIRFQKPYNLETRSETTVEIIDTPVVLDIDAKPAVRNQVGRAVITVDTNSGTGVQVSKPTLASNTLDKSIRFSESQWAQATGPRGGPVYDIFATPEGVLYAFSPTGTYRLAANATAWVLVGVDVPIGMLRVPMTQHEGRLYIVSTDEVFASTDEGETWSAFCSRPEGDAIGLIITDDGQGEELQTGITMYLALQDKGVFRSIDSGNRWALLNNGLIGRTISGVAAIRNTVFAGTDKGLYCLNSDVWEQLPVDMYRAVQTLVVFKDNLYVGTGSYILTLEQLKSELRNSGSAVHIEKSDLIKIFHSVDLGTSWTEITPTNESQFLSIPTGIRLLVTDEMLLVFGFNRLSSTDGGESWENLGFDSNLLELSLSPVVAVNENTFYKVGALGIYRTIDAGKSWHQFMDGIAGTGILDLVTFNNRLYVHTGRGIVQSTDGAESWESVRIDSGGQVLGREKNKTPQGNFHLNSKLAVTGNVLYGVTSTQKGKLSISSLSSDGNRLVPIQGVPAFEMDISSAALWADDREAKQTRSPEERKKGGILTDILSRRESGRFGAFAVSGKMFFAEYKQRLFKWQLGDLEWKDIGLINTGRHPDVDLKDGFKIAVSGETVYAGKQSGKLFQSFDGGNSWRDVTPNLPLSFTYFKEIVFAGSTIYVGTDKGVLASQTGTHWGVIADGLVIDKFAVGGITVYGAGDRGVYRLYADGKSEQVSPVVPGNVFSIAVDRDRLYVATKQRGMFHISIEERNHNLSRE